MQFRDLPIKRKLVGVIFLTSLSVLSLTCLGLLAYEIYRYKQTITRSLSTIADIISASSTAVLVFDEPKVAQEILLGLRAESEVTAAALYDRNGKIYATYPPDLTAASFPSAQSPDGIEFQAKHVTVSKPVVQGQKRVGTLFLKADLQEMYRRLSVYVMVLLVILSGSAFLAFFLSNFFERRISTPLLALANTARIISEQNDYSVRGLKISNDELGFLTDAFNDMLQQIQASVTETKRAEEISRKLAAIVESSDDAIISKDLDGIIISWNRGAERIFGYQPEEVIGKPITMLLPSDRLEEERNILQRIHRGERLEHYETIRRRKDGRLFEISLTVSPIKDANGKVIGASKIGRDITERKQAETALRQAKDELAESNKWLEKRVRERTVDLMQANAALEAEMAARKQAEMVHAQLAAIVESSSDAILSKTLDGVITSWNKGAEKMFGYVSEEIVGRSVSVLMPADRSDELAPFLERIQREETVAPVETVRARKDGRLVHVSQTLSPIKDEAGRVTGVSAIMQDISERKRLEAEILQVSEYEQQRIAEDLHDGLGQQLGGISFLSEVLKKNLAEQASPEAEGAAKISRLLTAAMAQTRSLARGLHPVEPETNGLMSALEDLASRVTDLFKASCRFECPRPVLIEDNTMATHLYRIAQEAVTNSFKHGRAQRIKIELTSTPERIILTVTDDGVGFPRNAQPSKGLGLRIMNRRASMIGGNFSVQEKVGGGTVAICTIQLSYGQPPKTNHRHR